MSMDNKYAGMLADAEKRAAQFSKALEPLRRDRAAAEKEHIALQKERATLQAKVNAFEADKLDMSDAEFLAAETNIRLLTVRTRRAGEAYAKAHAALENAEGEARATLRTMTSGIITQFEDDTKTERAALLASIARVNIGA